MENFSAASESCIGETSATGQSLRKMRRERIRQGRSPAGFASKPLQECSLKNLETLRLEPLKTMKSCPSHCETSATRQSLRKLRRERVQKGRALAGFCVQAIAELQPQKSRNVAFGIYKNNGIVPQPLRNVSHQAKPKKAAFGAHPTRQSPSRFCVQAIAELQPQKSRNVAFGTPKNNGIVPQPLRNFSHQAKPKKAASGAHPKRQSPSRFCVQAIAELQPQKSRNVGLGTPKNNEIVPQPLRNFSHQAKPKKAASGAHPKRQRPSRFCVQAIAELQLQKSRNVALGTPKNNGIVPQPLRNFSHQAKPKKAASGAHPKRQRPSRFCVPKPLRNCNFKNLETLLLEPLKTMESCPSHCETSATRQSETSATRQSLRKLRRERIRKGRAPAGFVPKPLRNRSRKNAETSLLEPKNKQKTMKKQRNSALATRTSHCETAAGKMPKRRFWNPLKRKKECPNHAKPQPENCRNVAFGTY